jgi:hypothetical protein
VKRIIIWSLIGAILGFILCWSIKSCGHGELPPDRQADSDSIHAVYSRLQEQYSAAGDSVRYWRNGYDSVAGVVDVLTKEKQIIDNQLDSANLEVTDLVNLIKTGRDTASKLIRCDSLASKIGGYIALISADSLKTAGIIRAKDVQLALLAKQGNSSKALSDSLKTGLDTTVAKYDSLSRDYKTLQGVRKAHVQLFISGTGQYYLSSAAAGGGFMLKDKKGRCYEADILFSPAGRVYQVSYKRLISLNKRSHQ